MDVFEEVLELIDGWVEDGTMRDLHGLESVSLLKINDYNREKEDLYGAMREKLERIEEQMIFMMGLSCL